MRSVCLHGHYYQPPREDPWLGVAPAEPSAAPDRNWNARITRECYAPAAAARLLNGAGWLRDVLNLYEWSSFDAAPTLLEWLIAHAPGVVRAMQQGDAASRHRTGFGNAWAQPFVHAILPLTSPRDLRTLVHWGRRNFEHHFGRTPEAMWLPEMAVHEDSLSGLAEAGIQLTLLAPHQAAAVRPLGAGPEAWVPVTPQTLDIRQIYRCRLPAGRSIDIAFRAAAASQDIAFGALLRDGAELAGALLDGLGTQADAVLSIAVDGETYGHHHRFAEMAVAYAIDLLRRRAEVVITNPMAHAAEHPPRFEVAIAPNTSWSCAHGIERWRSDCGCRNGAESGWSQAWRTPLRQAIDWLRDELAIVYETRGGEQLRDPWGARDRYVDCLLAPGRMESFAAEEGRARLSPGDHVRARAALEMARHALLMQTSCGWFFDDLAGIEPLLIMRHAARAIELAERFGRALENGFMDRLAPARSNEWHGGSGADLYRQHVRGEAARPARIAATSTVLSLMGQPIDVPGYRVQLPEPGLDGRVKADVVVVEESTGWREHVSIAGERADDGTAFCTADGLRYGIADLLPAQQELVLDELASTMRCAARAEQRGALMLARRLVEAADGRRLAIPPDLQTALWDAEADVVIAALSHDTEPVSALVVRVQALVAQGVRLASPGLVPAIQARVLRAIAALPGSVTEVQSLLELAAAASVKLDMASLQIALLQWWKAADDAERRGSALPSLLTQVGIAPD